MFNHICGKMISWICESSSNLFGFGVKTRLFRVFMYGLEKYDFYLSLFFVVFKNSVGVELCGVAHFFDVRTGRWLNGDPAKGAYRLTYAR